MQLWIETFLTVFELTMSHLYIYLSFSGPTYISVVD